MLVKIRDSSLYLKTYAGTWLWSMQHERIKVVMNKKLVKMNIKDKYIEEEMVIGLKIYTHVHVYN